VNEQTGQQLTEQPSDHGQAPGEQNIQEQTTDELAGWKTYTNDKYGFELRYPGDWISNDLTNFMAMPENSLRIGIGQDQSHLPIGVTAYVGDVKRVKDFGLLLNQVKNLESWLVGGVAASKYTTVNTATQDQCTEVIVIRKNMVYGITNCGGPEKEFNQILSTFKFTK